MIQTTALVFPNKGGGIFREKIFLKVRFQKAVGNSPSKLCFDFGRRCCRLSAAEPSLFQKLLQCFSGINFIQLPLPLVLFFRYLCIQNGAVLPDQFALLLADFLNDIQPLGFLGIIKDIKLNRVAFPLRFSQ